MTHGEGSSDPDVGGQVAGPAARGKPFLRGVMVGGVVAGVIGIGLFLGGCSSDEPPVAVSSATEATSETSTTTSEPASTDAVELTEPVLGWFWKLEAVNTVGYRGEEEFTQALFIMLEFDDSQDLIEMKPRYTITAPGLIHRFGTNMTSTDGCSHSAPEGDAAALESDFVIGEGKQVLEFDLTGEELTYRAYFQTSGPEWEITDSCPDSEGGHDGGVNVVWVDQWEHTPFNREYGEVIEGEVETGTAGFSIKGWTLIPCGTVEKLCEDNG